MEAEIERMKRFFLLCVTSVLLPCGALAQEGGRRAAGPSAEAGFQLAEPGGFRTREVFSRLELPLGAAGDYVFRSAARFSRLSVSDAPSVPGELHRTGAELSAENGGKSFKMNLESNSDRPFYGLDTINLDLTWTFTLSEHNGHALLGGLNYSTQRSFARYIPLPFVIYRYRSGDFFMLFPFMYAYRLSEKVSVSVRYFPVRNLKASLRYQPGPGIYADLEAGGELDQFLLARRPDKRERFYYQRYTAALKPSFRIFKDARLTGALGYFFKGSYYSGKTYADDSGKTAIGGAPYFSLSLKYAFGPAAPVKSAPPAKSTGPVIPL